jgi:predicted dehydrogenase
MDTILKAVLVGCGGMSRAWLKAAQEIPGLELAGLVDLVEASARQRAAEFGLARAVVSTDLARTLDSLHPDIVFDCTIPEAHVAVTLEALRHGCHVLGEKPMADSMENAHRMVEAAQKAGKLYAVIQNRRYMAQARRLKAFLQAGRLGPLTTANADFYIGAHFGGFRDEMQHPLLLDMAIHTFDAARFFTGADPVAVYCKEWNPQGSWYAHGASAVAVFEMTGGLVYTYRGSWCAEGLMTSWECEWRFVGPQGTLKWDGQEEMAAQVVTKIGGFHAEFENLEPDPYLSTRNTAGHADLIREFVSCVRVGIIPETVCTDNLKSLAMVFGAIESAETGKRVEIAI